MIGPCYVQWLTTMCSVVLSASGSVIRDANVIQLDVDSDVNHVVGPLYHSTQNARAPVFIGGAPGQWQSHAFQDD